MAILIITTDIIVAMPIRIIITKSIAGTIIHTSITMATITTTSINPEAITNVSTDIADITIDTSDITRNQDISMGTIKSTIIIRNHLMVTFLILLLASTQEILTLCYATKILLGEAKQQN